MELIEPASSAFMHKQTHVHMNWTIWNTVVECTKSNTQSDLYAPMYSEAFIITK